MTIDEFCETVRGIKPNNFMALNGAASFLGTADSGTDSVVQLQRATIEFANSFKSGSDDEARAARKEVVGKIMVAHALDAITEETADELLDALDKIMKGKE